MLVVSFKKNDSFFFRKKTSQMIDLYIWRVPIYKFNRFDFGKHTKTNTLNVHRIKQESKYYFWSRINWSYITLHIIPHTRIQSTDKELNSMSLKTFQFQRERERVREILDQKKERQKNLSWWSKQSKETEYLLL